MGANSGYDDFVVAVNPEDESKLPYLLRLPLRPNPVVFKARETWPRTSKVYCHRVGGWPDDAEVVERVPVRSCRHRGGAIDLILERGRENRSQFVFTKIRGGREANFWQTARTTKQARPNVSIPTARAAGIPQLKIVVDSHERYAYRFADQQVELSRAGLRAGDYGCVSDGILLATVERKSLADLVSTLTSGKLKYLLADLSTVPRAALVVEDRYSQVFKHERVRPSVIADGLAECQVRWPTVPIVFCETRPLAQEWIYRFLAAARVHAQDDEGGARALATLASAPALEAAASPAAIRSWAASHGFPVSDRGRISAEVRAAYLIAQRFPPE